MARLYRSRGITRVEMVVIGVVSVLVFATIPGVSRYMRTDASRATCAANLASIGKAMLTYANDYDGVLPKAGGRVSLWGQAVWWDAADRHRAFGLAADGSGGTATISSSFYLLVRHASLHPKDFVCPGDAGTSEFQLSDVRNLRADFTLADAWDFGPNGSKHCSYSYHAPYAKYALTTAGDPHMPVAADRNPWQRSPAGEPKSFIEFNPDIEPWNGSRAQARQGNSMSHKNEGQNVLFLDGHVSFEERSYCGLDRDNIYLVSGSPDRGSPLGTPPKGFMWPANSRDSLLIHDPPLYEEIESRPVENVDSKELERTAVVATLDCPLAEHKNTIWCSTFQMAWDRMKNDVIGEPIEVLRAEELAARLNRQEYPANGIEETSYYANAGFVEHGIIEQIQKDMAERFPSEPAPTFDGRYRRLPEVAVAYSYLNVDVGFEYPYYALQRPFAFQDSQGGRTEVRAFCAQSLERDPKVAQVRDQVEILCYKYGGTRDLDEFAVDLCKHTEPYQVVLVRMPRCEDLGEAVRVVQEKIIEFKDDRDYAILHKLRPIDTLAVPDVVYKLTHHFEELLGKFLGNEQWRDHFIFDAMQKIDFTLSRTGVILRSEARFATAASRGRPPEQLEQPRHLHFDRPFLIYVKKRDVDATPFFIMWVDNAELMKTWRRQ